MSHYAHLDPFNIVDEIIVADANFIGSLPDPERWVQTSYNTRGGIHFGSDGIPDGGMQVGYNYAGIGYSWDGIGFAAPRPFASWTLNKSTYQWEPPIPMPATGGPYDWFEPNKQWIAVASLLAV